MHHFNVLRKGTLLALSAIFVVSTAHADANEVTQQSLTRTAANSSVLQAKLSKNAYRQEPYQANYDVQVPYQADETYYVDVPYQDEEAYTDYEQYYSNDYVCHDYTDYENRCRTVTECGKEANPDIIQRAREGGPDPYPGNGGGGGSSPGRPDPYPEPTPRPPVCRDRQVCEQVPVTSQRCGYEQTSHTRAVTKYRTVTKYRSEARSRTVTKYRTESRCCVTAYRDVFDHQWGLDVQVQFPAGTELTAAEQEQFKIELIGSESAPDIRLTPVTTIFGYQVASKKVDRGVATIVLAQVARYKAADLKEKTLQNFLAAATTTGLTYKFTDNALFPRVSNAHKVELQDAITHQVVAQTEVQAYAQKDIAGSLAVAWDYTRNYEVVLKIHREGSVIESGVVDFEVRQPLQMVLDMAALKAESNIAVRVSGNLARTQIVLKDNTVPYASVATRYYITLVKKNIIVKNTVIAEKGFQRVALKAAADGSFVINIADFGAKSENIQNYLESGDKVQIVVEVNRTTADGQKIQFWKSADVVVP